MRHSRRPARGARAAERHDGLRSDAIEDRVTAWCGDPVPGWEGWHVLTVATNIGYLMPLDQYADYPASGTEAEADAGVQPLVADIAAVGLPYLRAHASYAGLARAITTGRGRVGAPAIERLPIAHALAGDVAAAHRALDEMRREVDEEALLMFRYLRYLECFEREFPAP